MIDLYNKLPFKSEIDTWINAYSGQEALTCSAERASLSYLLRCWNNEKQKCFNLLGQNFIIEKEINIDFDDCADELYARMQRAIEGSEMQQFLISYTLWVDEYAQTLKSSLLGVRLDIVDSLRRLIRSTVLAKNSYAGTPIKIEINGTEIAIQRGAKPSRILGKIAKAANLDGFEQFRLEHSRILNQKKLKGTMCLSIHPLDYMTMSDNTYNWDSCMNWRSSGCYREGTVEMMNSPYVVVAYLKGSETMRFFDKQWNSKKWRNLFIVTPETIIGVKGYPYQSEEFDRFCINWLCELSEKNLNISYYPKIYSWEFSSEEEDVYIEDKENNHGVVRFDFSTCFMYNDFGNSNRTHFVLRDLNTSNISCDYSGAAICMYCGEYLDCDDIEDAEQLICNSCASYVYCDACNERVAGNETYELDGDILCPECYSNYRVFDCIDQEEHHRFYCKNIYLIPEGVSFESLNNLDFSTFTSKYPFIEVSKYTNTNFLNIETLSLTLTSFWSHDTMEDVYCIALDNISDIPEIAEKMKKRFEAYCIRP